ncbi:prepilin-type N-terminal cleavage/methylation domain-containing protein [Pseudomonas fluorescens]
MGARRSLADPGRALKSRQAGFTLSEVLVAVAIDSVLAVITR